MKYDLGSKVRDIINGFEGVVTGRCEYITGCKQYIVAPAALDKDGKVQDSNWVDEMRLVLIEPPSSQLTQARDANRAPGGPTRNPAHRL
jgi:hypothetical protein